MKKVLITGANSYIGTSFENYVMQCHDYSIIKEDNQIKKAYKNTYFDVFVGNSIGMTSEMTAVVNAKKDLCFFIAVLICTMKKTSSCFRNMMELLRSVKV